MQSLLDIIVSVLIVVAAAFILRAWRSTIERLTARALRQTENLPRERQLKIQTLAAVSRATGTVLVLVIAALLVLSQFMDIAPLLAGAGIVGLAVGLGSQSLIRDVVNGFFILLENHYGVGDVIKINNQYAGVVEHLDLRRTVLRNLDGWLINVPNGEIRVVANMTKDWSRMVVDIKVSCRQRVDQVLQALRDAADELMAEPGMAALLLEPPEILGIEALTESHMTFRVLLKTQPTKQWEVGRRYRALVKQVFDRAGIEGPVAA